MAHVVYRNARIHWHVLLGGSRTLSVADTTGLDSKGFVTTPLYGRVTLTRYGYCPLLTTGLQLYFESIRTCIYHLIKTFLDAPGSLSLLQAPQACWQDSWLGEGADSET